MASALSPAEVRQFRANGFLACHLPILPPDVFAHLQRVTAFYVNHPRHAMSSRPERLDVPHFFEPAFHPFLLAEPLVDLAESIVGPNIALYSCHIICKPPSDGLAAAWHDDRFFFSKRLDPVNLVTVWLALDAASESNGCMRFLPRSHRAPARVHNRLDGEETIFSYACELSAKEASRAVSCELAPNECTLHDGRTLHSSGPNRSDHPRCGFAVRYMPTSVHVKNAGLPEDGFRVYLVRGEDEAGNHYAEFGVRNEAYLRVREP